MPSSSDLPVATPLPATPAAAAPQRINLPNPRHAQRLPSHIGKAQFERVRQAAYRLPQVVKPADYPAEPGASAQAHEELLDTRGFILLQKAVAGQRRRARTTSSA